MAEKAARADPHPDPRPDPNRSQRGQSGLTSSARCARCEALALTLTPTLTHTVTLTLTRTHTVTLTLIHTVTLTLTYTVAALRERGR